MYLHTVFQCMLTNNHVVLTALKSLASALGTTYSILQQKIDVIVAKLQLQHIF